MSDDDRSARAIARGKVKKDGERSSKLANQLMKLSEPLVKRLELDEELEAVLREVRAIPSQNARRRGERALAGALRGHDMLEMQQRIDRVIETGQARDLPFQLAEQWRAKVLEGGAEVAVDMPGGGASEELPRLIDAARRERDTARPPGAGRALFRHILEQLKHASAEPAATDDADDADEPDEG